MSLLGTSKMRRAALVASLGVLSLIFLAPRFAFSQIATGTSTINAVGGILIDPQGMLTGASIDAQGQLRAFREKALEHIPADLSHAVPLRKISLKALDEAIAQQMASGKPLSDAMQHLAGLQQIEYVLVYPEQHDIVLVGPAEGWKVNPHGELVGIGTGRPVMLLDDLLVALRSAHAAGRGGISCSIDPTSEGLSRVKQMVPQLVTMGSNPNGAATAVQEAMGQQTITVTGVPATSHFARVLVAADYRMKRLGMDFEPAPIRNFPSYLHMIPTSGRKGMANMLPRWWLSPHYEPLLRDPEGLAWQIRGAAVQTMTEEDFVAADGSRQHSGKASPAAQRWANLMTSRYEELALAEPIFGQLRNCMDLAVVAALIAKEDLPRKARCSLSVLLDGGRLKAQEFPAPRHVDTQASMVKRGTNWVISASGGVQINSWQAAAKQQSGDQLTGVRSKAAHRPGNWWWD